MFTFIYGSQLWKNFPKLTVYFTFKYFVDTFFCSILRNTYVYVRIHPYSGLYVVHTYNHFHQLFLILNNKVKFPFIALIVYSIQLQGFLQCVRTIITTKEPHKKKIYSLFILFNTTIKIIILTHSYIQYSPPMLSHSLTLSCSFNNGVFVVYFFLLLLSFFNCNSCVKLVIFVFLVFVKPSSQHNNS